MCIDESLLFCASFSAPQRDARAINSSCPRRFKVMRAACSKCTFALARCPSFNKNLEPTAAIRLARTTRCAMVASVGKNARAIPRLWSPLNPTERKLQPPNCLDLTNLYSQTIIYG